MAGEVIKDVIMKERSAVTNEGTSVLRLGGKFGSKGPDPEIRKQITQLEPYMVVEEFRVKAPLTNLVLQTWIEKKGQLYPVQEHVSCAITNKLGKVEAMLGKMANTRLSVQAAQTSLYLYAAGLKLEALDQLQDIGLTVSGKTVNNILGAELLKLNGAVKVINSAIQSKSTLDLAELELEPSLHIGRSNYQTAIVANRFGGISVTNVYDGENEQPQQTIADPRVLWIGDNINKNPKAKYAGVKEDKALNCFALIGKAEEIRDRTLSRTEPLIKPQDMTVDKVLPTPSSINVISEHFKVLICRTLVTHVPCLKQYAEFATWHITHAYTEVMEKSTLLFPGGVLDNDQKCNTESAKILDEVMKNIVLEPDTGKMRKTVFAGDQLTFSRTNSVKALRENEPDNGVHQILPDTGSFHFLMCFADAIMNEYESPTTKSYRATYTGAATAMNNKTAATRSVKKHYDKVVDMLATMHEVYTIAAFETLWERLRAIHIQENSGKEDFDPEKYGDLNNVNLFADKIHNKEDFQSVVGSITTMLLDYLVDLRGSDWARSNHKCQLCGMVFSVPNTLRKHKERVHQQRSPSVPSSEDGQYNYCVSLYFNILLFLNTEDAVREGDADREELCQRFILLFLRKKGKKNYVKAILQKLVTNKISIPAQDEHAMRHNSYVGLRDGRGHRIANDMTAERYIGLTKKYARKSTVAAIQKSSSTVGLVSQCTAQYCQNSKGIKKTRDRKPERSIRELVDNLKEDEIFVKKSGRNPFPGFEQMKTNFLFDESCRIDIHTHVRRFIEKTKKELGYEETERSRESDSDNANTTSEESSSDESSSDDANSDEEQ